MSGTEFVTVQATAVLRVQPGAGARPRALGLVAEAVRALAEGRDGQVPAVVELLEADVSRGFLPLNRFVRVQAHDLEYVLAHIADEMGDGPRPVREHWRLPLLLESLRRLEVAAGFVHDGGDALFLRQPVHTDDTPGLVTDSAPEDVGLAEPVHTDSTPAIVAPSRESAIVTAMNVLAREGLLADVATSPGGDTQRVNQVAVILETLYDQALAAGNE